MLISFSLKVLIFNESKSGVAGLLLNNWPRLKEDPIHIYIYIYIYRQGPASISLQIQVKVSDIAEVRAESPRADVLYTFNGYEINIFFQGKGLF